MLNITNVFISMKRPTHVRTQFFVLGCDNGCAKIFFMVSVDHTFK